GRPPARCFRIPALLASILPVGTHLVCREFTDAKLYSTWCCEQSTTRRLDRHISCNALQIFIRSSPLARVTGGHSCPPKRYEGAAGELASIRVVYVGRLGRSRLVRVGRSGRESPDFRAAEGGFRGHRLDADFHRPGDAHGAWAGAVLRRPGPPQE